MGSTSPVLAADFLNKYVSVEQRAAALADLKQILDAFGLELREATLKALCSRETTDRYKRLFAGVDRTLAEADEALKRFRSKP